MIVLIVAAAGWLILSLMWDDTPRRNYPNYGFPVVIFFGSIAAAAITAAPLRRALVAMLIAFAVIWALVLAVTFIVSLTSKDDVGLAIALVSAPFVLAVTLVTWTGGYVLARLIAPRGAARVSS